MTGSQNPKLLEDSTYLAKITCSIFRTRWKVPHILQQYCLVCKIHRCISRVALTVRSKSVMVRVKCSSGEVPAAKANQCTPIVAFVVYDTQMQLDARREIMFRLLYGTYTLREHIKHLDDKLTHYTLLFWPMAVKLQTTVTGSYF